MLADAHGELLAPFGRELLGIVQSEDDRLVGKRYGAHGERSRDGAAAHLVHSEDDTVPTQLALQVVERAHPGLLSSKRIPCLEGTLERAGNLLARVVGIAPRKRVELVGGCRRDEGGYVVR